MTEELKERETIEYHPHEVKKEVIMEDELKPDSIGNSIEKEMKKSSSIKLWTIFSVFIGLINLSFIVAIFAIIMMEPI